MLETIEHSLKTAHVTVVGSGTMGQAYVKTLSALGVGKIRVCSLSRKGLDLLSTHKSIETYAGGFENYRSSSKTSDSLTIIALPILLIVPAIKHFSSLGCRRFLIEKPVSLYSSQIKSVAHFLSSEHSEAWAAFNRLAYPSYQMAKSIIRSEGLTSLRYTFTEWLDEMGPQGYGMEVIQRWGIANSIHVLAMAHGLAGAPKKWSAFQTGSLPWHRTGSVFTGAGITDSGTLFDYHADWTSKDRWSIEFHTSVSAYRLCPLEKLYKRNERLGEWTEIELPISQLGIKLGLYEMVRAVLIPSRRKDVDLLSLEKTANIVSFAEDVFAYPSEAA